MLFGVPYCMSTLFQQGIQTTFCQGTFAHGLDRNTLSSPSSPHFIFIWSHVTSTHLISFHNFHLFHILWSHLISSHVMSCHVISSHLISCHLISLACYVNASLFFFHIIALPERKRCGFSRCESILFRCKDFSRCA